MNTNQIHPRLLGILRIAFPGTIIPDNATPRQAWEIIRPDGNFLPGSFWQVVGRKMLFAKTAAKQIEIAEYIYQKLESSRKNGKQWPPVAVLVQKQIFQPIPHTR